MEGADVASCGKSGFHDDRKMRPTETLPSTGIDILLVGSKELCQPIAESLLQSGFDNPKTATNADSELWKIAMRARNGDRPRRNSTKSRIPVEDREGRKHGSVKRSKSNFPHFLSNNGMNGSTQNDIRAALRARHVRMVMSLPVPKSLSPFHGAFGENTEDGNIMNKKPLAMTATGAPEPPRVDFVVFVVSIRDPSCVSFLERNVALLHLDYFMLNRTAVVALHADDNGAKLGVDIGSIVASASSRQRCSSLNKEDDHGCNRFKAIETKKRSGIFPAGSDVPLFRCDEKDEQSVTAVSRMLLQSATIGCRSVGDGTISPIFFSSFS